MVYLFALVGFVVVFGFAAVGLCVVIDCFDTAYGRTAARWTK